jgi:hypothetical protein
MTSVLMTPDGKIIESEAPIAANLRQHLDWNK